MESNPKIAKLKPVPAQIIPMDNGVVIKRGCTEVKVDGVNAFEILHQIINVASDGANLQEICAQFPEGERRSITSLVEFLAARHFLVPWQVNGGASNIGERPVDVFYWHFDRSPANISMRLRQRKIVIVGVNTISQRLASGLLSSEFEQIQIVDHPGFRNLSMFHESGELKVERWGGNLQSPLDFDKWEGRSCLESIDCLVVTSDFGGRELLREWNQLCIEHHCNFLPVILQNLIGYIGPFVIPGETACYACLLARENSHLNDPMTRRAVESCAVTGQHVAGFHPLMVSALADIAGFELVKFYSELLPMRRVGSLIEVNLLSTQITSRKVLKLPRCHICSPLNIYPSISPYKD